MRKILSYAYKTRIIHSHLLILILLYASFSQATELFKVPLGHSDIIAFKQPIKRVAIANPEVADANVTSPKQLLINGKSLGSTSLIIWDEQEIYTIYRLVVYDEAANQQIKLEVRFLEIQKSALKEFGTNLLAQNLDVGSEKLDVGSFAGKVNAPTIPLQLTNPVDLFFSIPTRDISGILKALEEKNLITTLANPNLSAINGAEASFLAGGEFPIPVAVVGGAGSQTISIQFKEFGVRLKFVPTISDTEFVNMKVYAEVSSLDFENGIILSGFRVPSLLTRKAETIVKLKKQEYLIIGGLLKNELTKNISRVPILGHIPILGRLFSSRRYLNEETELVILVSPQDIQTIHENMVPEVKGSRLDSLLIIPDEKDIKQ